MTIDNQTATHLLAIIAQQETDLLLPSFTAADAYSIGVKIREAANAAGRKVVISISKGEDLLFFHAMDTIKPINLKWLQRKIQTTRMYRCSSFSVGLRQLCGSGSFIDSGLDPAQYAGVGGCFPAVTTHCGFVGTIAVSGMEQQEDHQAVVTAVSEHFGLSTASVLQELTKISRGAP